MDPPWPLPAWNKDWAWPARWRQRHGADRLQSLPDDFHGNRAVGSVRTEYERHARDLAQSYLSDAAKRAEAAGVPCTTEMRESSNPYQAIVDLAMTQGCD